MLEGWMNNPLNKQVGGTHYKVWKKQPIKFIRDNNLPFIFGVMIKYIMICFLSQIFKSLNVIPLQGLYAWKKIHPDIFFVRTYNYVKLERYLECTKNRRYKINFSRTLFLLFSAFFLHSLLYFVDSHRDSHHSHSSISVYTIRSEQ